MAKEYLLSVLLKLNDKLTAPLTIFNKKLSAQLTALSSKLITTGKNLTKFLTLPILGLAAAAAMTAGEFEKQTVAFETLLGSTEKAGKLLKEIEAFSAATPFKLPGLISAGKKLLAFGFAAEEVVDVTKRLGDAAMGDEQKLGSLTDAFGKVRAKGKASMRELNMFTYAGVPLMAELAKNLDTTVEGVYELSSKGGVNFEMVNKAIMSLTTGTGRFAGMTAKMALTVPGLFSTMLDNIGLMGKAFGDEFAPMLKDLIRNITNFAKWIKNLDTSTKKMILSVLGLAAAIGPLLLVLGKVIKFFVIGVTPIQLFVMAIGLLAIAIITLNELFQKSKIAHQAQAKAMGEEMDETKKLKAEYDDLSTKTKLSNVEKQRMINLESILKKRIGETAFVIDQQTGKLKTNTEAFEDSYKVKYGLMIKELKIQRDLDVLEHKRLRLQSEKLRISIDADKSNSEFKKRAQEMLENNLREMDKLHLRVLETMEQIAALEGNLAGAKEETEDLLDEIYGDSPSDEDIPLLSIPTKVKKKIEDLQKKTGTTSMPDATVKALTQMEATAMSNSKIDVTIKVETDEGASAKITAFNKTGDANVIIDIDSVLGNSLSEVTS